MSDVTIEKKLIEEFLAKKKPSVTFEDQEKRHKEKNAAEVALFKEKKLKDEQKLSEYFKSKKIFKREHLVKQSKEMDNALIEIRSYKKQFESKAEGLAYFTKIINETFISLGYRVDKGLFIGVDSYPHVDLKGFDSVDDYYDYYEAEKIKNSLGIAA